MSGAILRKKREELGLDIRQVADQLRIRADYLSSIEQDLFDKLPAPVYTMGYIRSYARHLNVDPTAILGVYAERLPKPKTDTPAIPVVLAEKRRPWLLYLVLAVVVASAGAGIYLRMPHSPVQDRTETTGARTEAKLPAVAKQPAQAVEKTEPGIAALKEVPQSLPAAQKPPAGPSLPAAVTPGSESPGRIESGQDMHLLTIQAVETSWIYVKFRNGRYESATLKAGASRQWSFRESAYLKIGNAGGVRLTLDGRELAPVGQSGQVAILTLPQQPQ